MGYFGSVRLFLIHVFVVFVCSVARFLVKILMFNDNFGSAEASEDGDL